MPDFPDYPKLGVWSDAYYMSFNMFHPDDKGPFVGSRACAMQRRRVYSAIGHDAAARLPCRPLMYRLAYRNFPNDSPPHESLVVTYSVDPNAGTGKSGIRWYELRDPGGTPAVHQQSTFAPDSDSRWMGNIAMDRIGDMLVGYSDSSTSLHPGICYTGRAVTDPVNTMQSESSFIFAGGGSQLPNRNRWGDYSSMSIDPVDDRTFWYTQEYLKSDGTFNWSTHIASASFRSCFQLPSPPTVWIDAPAQGSVISGTVRVVGSAIDNTSGVGTAIASVQVKVDGVVVGSASYGGSRPDVCATWPGRPGCPNVGYSFSLNTSTLSVGSHTITVTATDSDGSRLGLCERFSHEMNRIHGPDRNA
jgi:hypothetical protein